MAKCFIEINEKMTELDFSGKFYLLVVAATLKEFF